MTNGEKFKEVFSITQVDECDLNVYAWLHNHDALDIPLEWWNAEYKETKTESVSLGVFEQVKWERDVAIQQLKELGYELGKKIRTDEDCISREAVLDTTICEGISCNECSFNEIDGEPGCLLHKRIDDLPPVKPKERTGEWINITNQDLHDCRTGNRLCFECPKCKSRFTYRSNYCPNCGCRLNEEVRE